MQNNSISFGAKFVNMTTVQKLVSDKVYKSKELPVIDLNPSNPVDLNVLKQLDGIWGKYSFAGDIYGDAYYSAAEISPKFKFYALTQQKQNIASPDPEEILALAELKEINPHKVNLAFLQVDPSLIDLYGYEVRKKFKQVGTAMLDFLKGTYSERTIELHSVPSAEEFYIRNGFKKIKSSIGEYSWQA